jgi:hypothetical protein
MTVPLWQVAVFGLALFAAYAVIIVIALRRQERVHARKLARVRAQRNRWRRKASRWASTAPAEAVNAEFNRLMQVSFIAEGGEG